MQKQYTEGQGLLGKLCPGKKKLEGKTFYLDGVKKRSTVILLEAISLLGGRIEGFLHKDVSFVVTDSKECQKEQKFSDVKEGAKDTNEETQCSIKQQESVLNSDRQRPVTTRPVACGSRGKALLEKAIRNNERLQGGSVLANARSWGVKILHVNDVVLYLKQLTRESFIIKQKRPEKTCTKQGSVKATALRSPYLKIEDSCRKYKPLHMQSMTFPLLCYSGRFSPFESTPHRFEKKTEEEIKTREKKKVESSIQSKCQTQLSCNPSPWRPQKKDPSYCECCHKHFTNLEEHLHSDQHRSFALDCSNYSVVDQLVADMLTEFQPNPSQISEEILNRPPTPLPTQDFCELEPLSDVEMEHAVQALRKEGSQSYSPFRVLSFGPSSPSPGVQLAIPNPATPPADIQSWTSAGCHTPEIKSHTCSPVMPVLDVEPQTHNSLCQQPDNLSPCPEIPCAFSDPYLLAPVLSPQLPTSYIMEPHSSYSDPPVLSPQQYMAEELVDEDTCEMHTIENLSESVTAVKMPTPTPLSLSVQLTNPESVKTSNQEGPLVFSGIITSNVLECDRLASCRSRSLPRQSSAPLNPNKRCRSASPENRRSKRRRITVEFGYSCRWTKQGLTSAKLNNDIMVKPEGYLSFDKTFYQIMQSCPNPHASMSSTSTVERVGSKQTSRTFCVTAVQNFTRAPHQINVLCHGSTSVADQPPQPLSLTSVSPLLQFPSNKSHSGFSSQDSRCSLSHPTSVCIESALIPDLATLSPSSSDSDWDSQLLSRMSPTSTRPLSPTDQSCELDKELLHRPCTWMHDTSYESRLHTVLQLSAPASSLCGEDVDPSAFSRTVVQIVKVQH